MFFYAPQQIAFQGTITGLRVSTVNGVALIDNAGAVIPTYADGNHEISIFASGLLLRGVLSSAGGAETLGAAKNSNPTFDANTTGWTGGGCTLASVVGGQSNNCLEVTRTGGTSQTAGTGSTTITVGTLLKLSGYVKSGTSGNETYKMYVADIGGGGSYASPKITGTSSGSWVQGSGYFTNTATDGTLYVLKDSATEGTMLFDEVALQAVTAPSTAGAVIVSAKGSATQNWATNQWAAASYNLASYQVIVRKLR